MTIMFQSDGEDQQAHKHTYTGSQEGSTPSVFITHKGRNDITYKSTDVDAHVENVETRILLVFILFFRIKIAQ
ncbi:hypothetical protein D3C80_1363710 [compost metagenome]